MAPNRPRGRIEARLDDGCGQKTLWPRGYNSSDQAQRALDHPAQGAQELHDLRLKVRDLIRAEPVESLRHHVLPWVWFPASTGVALTASGREHGLELRFSYYAKPVA